VRLPPISNISSRRRIVQLFLGAVANVSLANECRRRQREQEVRKVLDTLKQVTLLETSGTPRQQQTESVEEALRRLKELDEERLQRLTSRQLFTPRPKSPGARKVCIDNLSLAACCG